MNKLKLIQIIVKELEEIKTLSEEVAESQNDASLIIDLALNKARLLCQEIELLREISNQGKPFLVEQETDFNENEEEDEEVSDVSYSDPELEILNFEEQEFPEGEELPLETEAKPEEEFEEEEAKEEESAQEIPDEEEYEEDETEDDDLTDEEEDDEDEDLTELEIVDEEMEEEVIPESDEDNNSEEVFEQEDEADENEESKQETDIQVVELKNDHRPEVREIHIDDMDDDELEQVSFKPVASKWDRPVMHEIPKPEVPVQEKMVVGEAFQKERSLNDAIGENNNSESKLTNGPISSLRAAIGLNDRFLFIREIFGNNTDKYNTVIDKLDKLETIQQAVDYLKANLSLEKSDTSLKFVDLLKRRFSK